MWDFPLNEAITSAATYGQDTIFLFLRKKLFLTYTEKKTKIELHKTT